MFNPLQPFFYLAVYVALIYLRPQEYVASLVGLPILPISLAAAFGLWLLRGPKHFDAPQHALMVAFLLSMALSVLASGWAGGAVNILNEFYPIVILFYLTAAMVDSPARHRQMFIVVAAVTTIIALDGIQQARTGMGWSGAKPVQDGRITYLGILSDPNDLSIAFLMALPMTLYLVHSTRNLIVRMVGYASVLAMLYGIYLTNSRGAVMALAAMVGLYSLQRFGTSRSLLLVPPLLLALVMFAPSRMETVSAGEASAAGRIEAWYSGLQMFMQHPVFGVGKGNFTEHHHLTAHNSFVLAFAELGLVGYFFWLSLIVLSLQMLYRILRTPVPGKAAPSETEIGEWSEYQRVANVLLYAFAGFLVSVLFLSRTYLVLLYFLIALVVALYQNVRIRWPEFPPVEFGPMLGRMLVLEFASIFFFWLLTRVLLGYT